MVDEPEEKKEEEKELQTPEYLYEKTEKVVKELKAENDRREKQIEELSKLKARDILGGRTEAGVQPAPPKELTPLEYLEKLEKGEIDVKR